MLDAAEVEIDETQLIHNAIFAAVDLAFVA
jgi:hypothetical protein